MAFDNKERMVGKVRTLSSIWPEGVLTKGAAIAAPVSCIAASKGEKGSFCKLISGFSEQKKGWMQCLKAALWLVANPAGRWLLISMIRVSIGNVNDTGILFVTMSWLICEKLNKSATSGAIIAP